MWILFNAVQWPFKTHKSSPRIVDCNLKAFQVLWVMGEFSLTIKFPQSISYDRNKWIKYNWSKKNISVRSFQWYILRTLKVALFVCRCNEPWNPFPFQITNRYRFSCTAESPSWFPLSAPGLPLFWLCLPLRCSHHTETCMRSFSPWRELSNAQWARRIHRNSTPQGNHLITRSPGQNCYLENTNTHIHFTFCLILILLIYVLQTLYTWYI